MLSPALYPLRNWQLMWQSAGRRTSGRCRKHLSIPVRKEESSVWFCPAGASCRARWHMQNKTGRNFCHFQNLGCDSEINPQSLPEFIPRCPAVLEGAFVFLKLRAFYLFKRGWGRKPQNLSYSLQILLLAFCSCWGGKKKPTRGESKHFTGKYTLALSHPHLPGKNKYLLRNGLKTFLLSIVFWEQGWVAICQSTATRLNFGFFRFFFVLQDG